jgi:hypothetical protein
MTTEELTEDEQEVLGHLRKAQELGHAATIYIRLQSNSLRLAGALNCLDS